MSTSAEEMHADHQRVAADAGGAAGSRRRWLIPAMAVAGAIAAALVVAGIVSPVFVIYAGALAGCGLMHLFGHGSHGGHNGHGDHR